MHADTKTDAASVGPVTRRAFLSAGMTAASGAAVPLAGRVAAEGAAADAEPAIDPGFFASQYYDSREEAALHDVVETGAPFRYWGPVEPKRVKHFEEAYAKYMRSIL